MAKTAHFTVSQPSKNARRILDVLQLIPLLRTGNKLLHTLLNKPPQAAHAYAQLRYGKVYERVNDKPLALA